MLIPAGFAQVNLKFGGVAYPRGAQVVFGVQLDSGLDTPITVANKVQTHWVFYMSPLQTVSITLQAVRVKFGPNATGAEAEVGFANAGGNADQTMPAQVAALATKITALGGRKQKGRMFFPGIGESNVAGDNVIAPAALAALNAHAADFLTSLGADDIPMMLLHNDATDPTGVNELRFAPLVATQRRRLRKVGGRRRVVAP